MSTLRYAQSALEDRVARLERQHFDVLNRFTDLKIEDSHRRSRRIEIVAWLILAAYVAVIIGIFILKRRGVL